MLQLLSFTQDCNKPPARIMKLRPKTLCPRGCRHEHTYVLANPISRNNIRRYLFNRLSPYFDGRLGRVVVRGPLTPPLHCSLLDPLRHSLKSRPYASRMVLTYAQEPAPNWALCGHKSSPRRSFSSKIARYGSRPSTSTASEMGELEMKGGNAIWNKALRAQYAYMSWRVGVNDHRIHTKVLI